MGAQQCWFSFLYLSSLISLTGVRTLISPCHRLCSLSLFVDSETVLVLKSFPKSTYNSGIYNFVYEFFGDRNRIIIYPSAQKTWPTKSYLHLSQLAFFCSIMDVLCSRQCAKYNRQCAKYNMGLTYFFFKKGLRKWHIM